MIEVACEACGWVAITAQPINQVWAEHEATCPAVGGAARHLPDPPARAPTCPAAGGAVRPRPDPPPRPLQLLPPVAACKHRPVRRQIAVTPSGKKLYMVACDLCGRLLEDR